MITVLGAGGIGKTTVALAVGHAAWADFSGAVFFVDLSTVRDKEQVIDAIASAIAIDVQFGDSENALFSYLRPRKALIVFDSCEHLIEKTAVVIERVFQRAPHICMLATSREALQISDERIYHLHPFHCPPEQPTQTAAQAMSYPAVQLFVERVSEFSLGDEEALIVAEICRKLDGIALAIELAAGTAAILGVKETAARLRSRLDLRFGRRTANPRHQTLRAVLDWSHDHLSEIERILLRRVAIFVGRFTLEAAIAVADEEVMDRSEIADAVVSLVNKSLIGVRLNSQGTSYRLLDTTRSYYLEKLGASGELDGVAARHASFWIRLLEANSIDLFDFEASEAAIEPTRDSLANVRAALEWSFGPNGDERAGVGLAAASAQLFLAMLLLLECRNWMEKAVERMTADSDLRHQMEVYGALALSLMFTEGNSERVRGIFQTALILAERREDASQQMRLLSGLSMYSLRILDPVGALEVGLRSGPSRRRREIRTMRRSLIRCWGQHTVYVAIRSARKNTSRGRWAASPDDSARASTCSMRGLFRSAFSFTRFFSMARSTRQIGMLRRTSRRPTRPAAPSGYVVRF